MAELLSNREYVKCWGCGAYIVLLLCEETMAIARCVRQNLRSTDS